MILDPNSYLNDIWITIEMKNRLADLIDDYKDLNENQDYNDVLDDILADLNTHSNRTVGWIINNIE